MDSIRFSDRTWTYKGTEGELYGQHYMGRGACNFIRWHLIGGSMVKIIRRNELEKERGT